MREEAEIKEDHQQLAMDLKTALDKRVKSVVGDRCLSVLEVFDDSSLVALHRGCRADDVLKLDVPDGEYETYGVEECRALLSVACKMPHVSTSGMDFDPRLAFHFMKRIKEAVQVGIWDGLCSDWFRLANDCTPLPLKNSQLASLEAVESETLDTLFKMKFCSGKEFTVRLQEQSFYSSVYSNEDVYSVATTPSCALLDIALSKGGPESIAESFHNSMRAQQQSGGQLNETLARRTKLNWCLPSLKKCDSIIKESVHLYFTGDDVIRRHRKNTLFSSRAKEYSVSKVFDRVDSELGRCPFLAE